MQFLTTTSEGYISLFFTLALMLVLLYFMIYRPQKKQEKKDAAMRAALEIGDQVVTITLDQLHQFTSDICILAASMREDMRGPLDDDKGEGNVE